MELPSDFRPGQEAPGGQGPCLASCHTVLSPVPFFENGVTKPQLREFEKRFPGIEASRSSSAGEGSSEGKKRPKGL